MLPWCVVAAARLFNCGAGGCRILVRLFSSGYIHVYVPDCLCICEKCCWLCSARTLCERMSECSQRESLKSE